MNSPYHVIIVGGGMAGMAAADLLSRHGLRILVVDDNAHAGGQLLRKPMFSGGSPRRFEPNRFRRRGMQLVERLMKQMVPILNGAQVLGIFPGRTLLVEDNQGRVMERRAEALILATGARERQLPFKGWDLPGVISTGAAQILMKSSGILPGKETLVGGCGPLPLATAAEIVANGGKVHAVLDQNGVAEKLKVLAAGPSIWPKLVEGAVHLARLAAARVPMMQGMRIVEAIGRQQLEGVVAARVDAYGHVVQGSERIIPTETVAVGCGFSPNIELPRQAGCSISHSVDKGGWCVDVNNAMETSVERIYAVGETTGVAGAEKSFLEGQIAAWDILFKQGRVDERTRVKQAGPLLRGRRRQIRYGRFLNRLCRVQPGWCADIPDKTIVCRCEEITMGEIRGRLNNGFNTINGVKRAARCGMGHCQGRTCGPIVQDIISAYTQRSPMDVGTVSVRAPVKPVALGALARATISRADNHDQQDHDRSGKGRPHE
ncbi:MAG: FAD-dependent oxidoreductase [bacterium]|nr:FAD-dependent oxidoreductase [bacterium]